MKSRRKTQNQSGFHLWFWKHFQFGKRYVEVDVRFSTEGRLRPLQIIFDKGQVYKIDKIKDICRRAADVGGVGDRYTCMIQGKERELWFEDGRWFVAAKVATSQAPPSNA